MNDALAALRRTFLDALRPDALLTVSEWADAFRVLDPATSGEPGRWRTDRTPYAREPMDRLSPTDPCTMVVLMWSAQIGKSEVGLNWLGRAIHHSPGPALMVQPTVEAAERFSKQRFARMFAATPELHERVGDPKSRDGGNTLLSKEYPGGVLILTGSTAPAGLSSMPVRYLDLDEVDRFAHDAGSVKRADGVSSGEGDPVALAIQRTATFANRKILMTSTPTVKGASRIEDAYEASDKRRYHVPCPDCGEFQALVWANLKWQNGDPATARYQCERCGVLLEDRQKTWMLARGEWRAQNPEAGGRVHGYHLSALYSPHGWTSWSDLVREWLDGRKDPERLKVFVNTKLAETWDPIGGEVISSDGLLARAVGQWGTWTGPDGVEHRDSVPDGVLRISAGVDTQDDRLEVHVIGWGIGEQAWSIDYRVIGGDPSSSQVWDELDTYLSQTWTTTTGWRLDITATCVDTGGHHTQRAYDFVRAKRGRRVWAIKGRGGPLPIWPRMPSKNNLGKVDLYMVGVDSAKELLYARWKTCDEPGPGYMHFPRGRQPEWFDGLTAERMVVSFHAGHKRIEWKLPAKARNEPLDTTVYALAALRGWLATGARLARAPESRLDKPQESAAASLPVSSRLRQYATPGAPSRQPHGAGDAWLT